ncbi:hypothetical protein AKJ09_05660 [Labilithrix luteola]|uniref:Lipoprotein n=1 Tax=Labilithrix luteola TaxID=1391654 RepID=A0A0K1Q030_9BACT|nr:hypothetical protein [Labilithrix luteola]AKU98996.1 hypothetical protein AKJ09_05660 [Labilithrix luteola]
MIRSCPLFAIAALVAACGLDAVGSATFENGATPDGGPSSPPPRDSGTSSQDAAPQEPQPCANTAKTCTQSLESGWTTLAVATTDQATCPMNYEITTLEHYGATAGDGACTCGCQIDPSDPPSCAKGKLSGKVGSNQNACDTVTSGTDIDGTGCTALSSATISPFGNYAPLPLYRGKCTSIAQQDESKVVEKAVRACKPSAACEETLCEGDAPTGFDACIIHDGDVACPANSSFTKKTLAGSGTSLTCSGCATCENSATCSDVTLRYYNDAMCNTEIASRPANGTCAPATSNPNKAISRLRYDVTTTGPTCSSTSVPESTLSVTDPKTICCR